MHPLEDYLRTQSRRQFLQSSGFGLGTFALGSLLAKSLPAKPRIASPANPLSSRPSHFAPKAKHVIYLHMIGAPSQLDLFDHKPALIERDGQACPSELLKGKRFAFIGGEMSAGAGSDHSSPLSSQGFCGAFFPHFRLRMKFSAKIAWTANRANALIEMNSFIGW